ncbi:hypothetical protein Ga0466249_004843 [Sporomusaceae bacterium BoRhaA]|uniref:hypothetical protein n=1 Tax=Pelorhabdus rhamnosifermentans TaxID=2772457 RepID=UPI001FE4BAA2|nr:hypothetical protein [Pelorhabdus rhamnosifermentans]MBU2703695.1 hypothetical protein [Pelorhabdus rhamnosifermentans]
MAYDATKPEDTGYLSAAPTELRTNLEGLKKDQIVDAGTLKGLTPGNANGNIPVSNGVENTNLNAGMVNGKTAADFAPKAHGHDAATSSSDGFETAAEHNKLAGIAEGAEVNQMAFSSVKVGDTTIQADSKTDTFEIVPGANIGFAPDAVNDKATIFVTGKVPAATQADTAGACTGNAATASVLYNFSVSTRSDVDVNTRTISGMFAGGGSSPNMPGSYLAGISANNIDVGLQIAGGYNSDNLYFRGWWSYGNSFSPWRIVVHSGNIGNQSVNYATTAGSAPANGGNADTARGATANIFSVKGTTANPPSYRFNMSDVVTNDFYMSSDGTVRLVDYTHAVYRPFRAAEIYSNDKQVATVDQVTSIVASGSGTNYYWRKWSNGDIEQWVTGGSYQAIGHGNSNSWSITFPVAFSTSCKGYSATCSGNVGIITVTGLSISRISGNIYNLADTDNYSATIHVIGN